MPSLSEATNGKVGSGFKKFSSLAVNTPLDILHIGESETVTLKDKDGKPKLRDGEPITFNALTVTEAKLGKISCNGAVARKFEVAREESGADYTEENPLRCRVDEYVDDFGRTQKSVESRD